MPRLILANQATAARRRCYFHLTDATDGISAETGESGGQPQISTNGAAFTNTGIGTLTHIGSGRYYADLTQAAVLTAGDVIETRYKSANTAETPGDTFQIVAFDPDSTSLGLALAKTTNITGFNDLSAAQVNTEADTALTDYGALKPTTAGRTLDVSATGEAGVDWANVGSPTTVVGLSGTTVKTATDVETDTQDIQSRLPAALTGAGNIKADALALSGDTVAADNAESFFDGTGYAGTGNTIPTVTTVGTLTTYTGNTPQTGDAYARLGAPAGASVSADVAAIKTDSGNLISRLGAFTGTGVNTVLGFLKAALSKVASTPSDVGGTFDPATDSTEAIRDRGDAAWVTGTTPPTASAIADQVWDELIAGHAGAGSTGEALADAQAGGGGGGSAPTVVEIREEMDANSTRLTSLDSGVTNLGTDMATLLTRITEAVAKDSTVAKQATLSTVSAAVASLLSTASTLTAQDIEDALEAALRTDTIPELSQGIPSATPTFAAAIALLYMMNRNGYESTATAQKFKNDAGTVVFKRSASDDNTTLTVGEMVSGP
jgi:hypothetical protein